MNKERISKILSISLILVFVLSIVLIQKSYANITSSNNTSNIIVNNIEAGTTVSLYQIATVEYDYKANQPKEGYKWNPSIQEWIAEKYPNYINSENFYKEVENNSQEAQTFYDELIAAIKSGAIQMLSYRDLQATGDAQYPVTEDNLTGNVNFEDVEMGTYLVLIENGYMIYTPSVVNLIPRFDENTKQWVLEEQNVIIKATNIGITKTVTDDEKIVDNYSTIDEITYTIEADIPTYLQNSLSKNYYIADVLDPSLTIDIRSLIVYGLKDGQEEKLSRGFNAQYNMQIPNSSETAAFILEFDYDEINKYDELKLIYNAKLNKNADLVVGPEGNKNYAYLNYSNDPYNETSLQTQRTDEVAVYTYGIEVKSVDKENTPLPGSEFTLYDEEGNEKYFIKGEDAVYYLSDPEEKGATTNLVVDEEGNLYLYGLDEGDYTIKQTKAPEGYNLSNKSYEITLVDKEPDGVLDEDYSLIFSNTKGFTLPVTGGKGTAMIVGIGIMLVVIGVCLLVYKAKKRK